MWKKWGMLYKHPYQFYKVHWLVICQLDWRWNHLRRQISLEGMFPQVNLVDKSVVLFLDLCSVWEGPANCWQCQILGLGAVRKQVKNRFFFPQWNIVGSINLTVFLNVFAYHVEGIQFKKELVNIFLQRFKGGTIDGLLVPGGGHSKIYF